MLLIKAVNKAIVKLWENWLATYSKAWLLDVISICKLSLVVMT